MHGEVKLLGESVHLLSCPSNQTQRMETIASTLLTLLIKAIHAIVIRVRLSSKLICLNHLYRTARDCDFHYLSSAKAKAYATKRTNVWETS
jgi:hypothetical protein